MPKDNGERNNGSTFFPNRCIMLTISEVSVLTPDSNFIRFKRRPKFFSCYCRDQVAHLRRCSATKVCSFYQMIKFTIIINQFALEFDG